VERLSHPQSNKMLGKYYWLEKLFNGADVWLEEVEQFIIEGRQDLKVQIPLKRKEEQQRGILFVMLEIIIV